eukprot:1146328-Pelagomonas_calceolata.AAC.3
MSAGYGVAWQREWQRRDAEQAARQRQEAEEAEAEMRRQGLDANIARGAAAAARAAAELEEERAQAAAAAAAAQAHEATGTVGWQSELGGWSQSSGGSSDGDGSRSQGFGWLDEDLEYGAAQGVSGNCSTWRWMQAAEAKRREEAHQRRRDEEAEAAFSRLPRDVGDAAYLEDPDPLYSSWARLFF